MTQTPLNYVDTLWYYDGPLVFYGLDGSGMFWVCTAVELTDEHNRFVCQLVQLAELVALCAGEMDLRHVYDGHVEGQPFYVDMGDDPMELVPVPTGRTPEDWLPGEGCFLSLREMPEGLADAS